MPSVKTFSRPRGSGAAALPALFTLSALLWPHLAQAADSLRCGSRLVSVEASMAEVQSKCGAPDYRDRWQFGLTRPPGYAADTEVWYYNLGPSQLLRILKFRNGRLVGIDYDGYGFSVSDDRRCAPGDIVEGLSKYRLLMRCGEPQSRDTRQLLVPAQSSDGRIYGDYLTPVYREDWVYNFGPRYLQREVRLENGFVTEVQSGERGFDPH
jgi:hypothetical protein